MSSMAPCGDNQDKCKPAGSWRKSSYSMSNGQCVEVANLGSGRLGVRDSQAVGSAGAVLHFRHHAWSAFTAGLRVSR
jgi:hypothetical protein